MNELKFQQEQMNKKIFTHKPQISERTHNSSRGHKSQRNVFKRLVSSPSADFLLKREKRCEQLRKELMITTIDGETAQDSTNESPIYSSQKDLKQRKNSVQLPTGVVSSSSIINRLLSARNSTTGLSLTSLGQKKRKSTPGQRKVNHAPRERESSRMYITDFLNQREEAEN